MTEKRPELKHLFDTVGIDGDNIQETVSRKKLAKKKQSVLEDLNEMILRSLPKNIRKRAISLLAYLLKFGKEAFQIERSGTLRVYGKKMDSVIVDYLYSVLTNKGVQHQPKDYNYFSVAMEQMNVPSRMLKKSKISQAPKRNTESKRRWLSY